MLLVAFLGYRGINWLLEQPMNSMAFLHPYFQRILRMFSVRTHRFKMMTLGAQTAKPSTLYSNTDWVGEIVEYAYELMPATPTGKTFTKRA